MVAMNNLCLTVSGFRLQNNSHSLSPIIVELSDVSHRQ